MSILELQEELYQTIETIIKRYVAKQNITVIYEGFVVSIPSTYDGKYTVSIKGRNYSIKDGIGLDLAEGNGVWICAPGSDWNKAYICAKKN